MNENPWEVESIMAFYFLKCPECEFDTQKETDFEWKMNYVNYVHLAMNLFHAMYITRHY